MRRGRWVRLVSALVAAVILVACQTAEPVTPDDLEVPEDVVARVVIFQADDCGPCEEITSDLIEPLQSRCGSALELKKVDITTSDGYEAFAATEERIVGESGRWDIPVVVVDDMAYVGDSAIRGGLLPYIKCVFGAGGNEWPAVPELQSIAIQPTAEGDANPFGGATGDGVESCVDDEESAVCASPVPIFALYLTGAQCADSCERTRYDLTYLKGVYPQLSFETRAMEDNRELADALAEELGVREELWGETPVVVVGEDYLVGDRLNLETLRERLAAYVDTGAPAVWYTLDLTQ